MDLRVYYQKLRQIESELLEPYVVLVSNETPDGGRAGVRTEVSKRIAARMVVEASARLASESEAAGFRVEITEARREAEQLAAASRLQVTVVTESEGKKPAGGPKSSKL